MEPTREKAYQQRIAELEKEVTDLKAQVAALIEHNAKLAEQAEQVAGLSKNSSNFSKPPSSDIVKPPKDTSSKGPRRCGGQKGHAGVNRPPFPSERIDKTEDLQPGDCTCGCHGRREPMGESRIHQVAELRDDPVIVTEYRLYGYVCPKCGQAVWATRPEGVVEGQLFDPRLQALIAYMKGSLHASYTGLKAFCRDVLNLDVSRSHLCNVIARVNEALSGPYEELQRDKIPKDRFDRRITRIKKRILALANADDLPPKSTTLAKRFRKHGDAMFRFLFDPAVPPTNNAAERGIRGSVIDRRITQGRRSLMGRQWNARIWTVLDTCRKQGRSTWNFLQTALSAHYFQTSLPSLLPQAQRA